MEFVEIPIQMAMKAARHYRPLLAYVNKFKAEKYQREKAKVQPEIVIDTADFILEEFKKVKEEYEAKTVKELVEIAKEKGIEHKGLNKADLIEKLLGQQ
jgi:hypothetical protein